MHLALGCPTIWKTTLLCSLSQVRKTTRSSGATKSTVLSASARKHKCLRINRKARGKTCIISLPWALPMGWDREQGRGRARTRDRGRHREALPSPFLGRTCMVGGPVASLLPLSHVRAHVLPSVPGDGETDDGMQPFAGPLPSFSPKTKNKKTCIMIPSVCKKYMSFLFVITLQAWDYVEFSFSRIGKRVCQGYTLSPCLFNLYAEYILQNAG